MATELTETKGDTFTYTATIKTKAGAAYNLGGCTVWFTLKTAGIAFSDATDANAIASCYWVDGGASSGIAVATPSLGVAIVTVAASVMDTLVEGIDYVFDIQIKDSLGKIVTADNGAVVVDSDVTRRVTTP